MSPQQGFPFYRWIVAVALHASCIKVICFIGADCWPMRQRIAPAGLMLLPFDTGGAGKCFFKGAALTTRGGLRVKAGLAAVPLASQRLRR